MCLCGSFLVSRVLLSGVCGFCDVVFLLCVACVRVVLMCLCVVLVMYCVVVPGVCVFLCACVGVSFIVLVRGVGGLLSEVVWFAVVCVCLCVCVPCVFSVCVSCL